MAKKENEDFLAELSGNTADDLNHALGGLSKRLREKYEHERKFAQHRSLSFRIPDDVHEKLYIKARDLRVPIGTLARDLMIESMRRF